MTNHRLRIPSLRIPGFTVGEQRELTRFSLRIRFAGLARLSPPLLGSLSGTSYASCLGSRRFPRTLARISLLRPGGRVWLPRLLFRGVLTNKVSLSHALSLIQCSCLLEFEIRVISLSDDDRGIRKTLTNKLHWLTGHTSAERLELYPFRGVA